MQQTPGAVWEPVASHSGPMSAHLGLVLHVQVGDGDPRGWFSDPANQASSTWWVAKDGTLVQYVDADLIAWTQAAGNPTWNGVETEGYPNEPLTNAQILTLARLYVWGHNTYGWPLVASESPTEPGFGWHGMGGVPWGDHLGCPGDIRKGQRAAVLYLADLELNPPRTQGEPKMWTTINGKLIATDAKGNLYCRPGAVAHIVTLQEHPEWGAGDAQDPCVGIVAELDGNGTTWGYTYITAPVSGTGGFGPYNTYHINADGTF